MATFRRVLAASAAAALALTACGGDDAAVDTAPTSPEAADSGDPEIPDGPPIMVGSFNFGESQILGNIYALALEEAGYPVETDFDLGTREFIFPELEAGNIDLLPEYAGSALAVGFGGNPTGSLEETLDLVAEEFAAIGVNVLEPAPGQDANAFAVTQEFADEYGLDSIDDLAGVDREVVFGGPPECEQRTTCLLALTDLYGLDNIRFESIQEGSVRVSSLSQGAIDVALLFSTQPVIAVEGFVVLDDPEGAVPVENIVPVLSGEVYEAYGDDLVAVINRVSALITTDVLIALNAQVELDADDPRDVATEWLTENGFLR